MLNDGTDRVAVVHPHDYVRFAKRVVVPVRIGVLPVEPQVRHRLKTELRVDATEVLRTDFWLEHIAVQMVATRRNRVEQKIPSRLSCLVTRVLEHTDDVAVLFDRDARCVVCVQECPRAVFGQLFRALRVDHCTVAVRRARRVQCFGVSLIVRCLPQIKIRYVAFCRATANGFG